MSLLLSERWYVQLHLFVALFSYLFVLASIHSDIFLITPWKDWFSLLKIITETFLEESGINDRIKLGDTKARILEGILRTRVAGWTVTKQAEEFHVSVDTVNKYIRELKDLYDETQQYSLILPTRKQSKKEQELDKSV